MLRWIVFGSKVFCAEYMPGSQGSFLRAQWGLVLPIEVCSILLLCIMFVIGASSSQTVYLKALLSLAVWNHHLQSFKSSCLFRLPLLNKSDISEMSAQRQVVNSDQAPPPRPFYNQAVIANGFVFCSGQLPKDSSGKIVEGTVQDRAVCVDISFSFCYWIEHDFGTRQSLADKNDRNNVSRIWRQFLSLQALVWIRWSRSMSSWLTWKTLKRWTRFIWNGLERSSLSERESLCSDLELYWLPVFPFVCPKECWLMDYPTI